MLFYEYVLVSVSSNCVEIGPVFRLLASDTFVFEAAGDKASWFAL